MLVTRVPSRANGDVSRRRQDDRLSSAPRSPVCRRARADVGETSRSRFARSSIRATRSSRKTHTGASRRCDTPDRYTVVVRLRQRWNARRRRALRAGRFRVRHPARACVPSTDVTQAAWNQRPFGTGPFRVVAWERANRIVLEPNPYLPTAAATAPHRLRADPHDAGVADRRCARATSTSPRSARRRFPKRGDAGARASSSRRSTGRTS